MIFFLACSWYRCTEPGFEPGRFCPPDTQQVLWLPQGMDEAGVLPDSLCVFARKTIHKASHPDLGTTQLYLIDRNACVWPAAPGRKYFDWDTSFLFHTDTLYARRRAEDTLFWTRASKTLMASADLNHLENIISHVRAGHPNKSIPLFRKIAFSPPIIASLFDDNAVFAWDKEGNVEMALKKSDNEAPIPASTMALLPGSSRKIRASLIASDQVSFNKWIKPYSTGLSTEVNDQLVFVAVSDTLAMRRSLETYASKTGILSYEAYLTYGIVTLADGRVFGPLLKRETKYHSTAPVSYTLAGDQLVLSSSVNTIKDYVNQVVAGSFLAEGPLSPYLGDEHLSSIQLFDHQSGMRRLLPGCEQVWLGMVHREWTLGPVICNDMPDTPDPEWQFRLDDKIHSGLMPADQSTLLVQDESTHLYAITSEGELLWKKKLGQMMLSEAKPISISGLSDLCIVFNTPSHLWLMDINGNVQPGFPLELQQMEVGVSVVDHYHNGDPTFYLGTTTNQLYALDRFGRPLDRWKPADTLGPLAQPISHLQTATADYLFVENTKGKYWCIDKSGHTKGLIARRDSSGALRILDTLLYSNYKQAIYKHNKHETADDMGDIRSDVPILRFDDGTIIAAVDNLLMAYKSKGR